MLFLDDLSALSGKSKTTVSRRLKRGWSALEVILGKKESNR